MKESKIIFLHGPREEHDQREGSQGAKWVEAKSSVVANLKI